MRLLSIVLVLGLTLMACRPANNNASANNTSTTSTVSNESSSTDSSTDAVSSQLRVELSEDPKLGNLPITVYVLDGANGVSGAEIEITGDMTHAGMVPVIVNATEMDPGLYQADEFEFTMAGDWIITTEVTLPDGQKLMDETKVTVPGR